MSLFCLINNSCINYTNLCKTWSLCSPTWCENDPKNILSFSGNWSDCLCENYKWKISDFWTNKYPRGPAFPWVVLWDPHFEQLLFSDCHFFCCHTSVTCSHHFCLWPKGGSTAYGPSFHMLLASITSSASLLLTASHWSISS